MKGLRISQLSAYARPEPHLTRRTVTGGVVTLLGLLVAVTLSVYETSHFWHDRYETKMTVDVQRRGNLPMNLDISFPAVPCAALSIELLDQAGTADSDVNHASSLRLHKARLDSTGQRVTREEYHTPQSQQTIDMGAAAVMSIDMGAAMQQLSDIDEELEHHEGCRLWGTLSLKRVAGRVHLSVHQETLFELMPELLLGFGPPPRLHNISHVIHRLSLGPWFPGQVNPLDGLRQVPPELKSFQYHLKVVPTEFHTTLGSTIETSQYSVQEYSTKVDLHAAQAPAGVELIYDFSPILVTIDAESHSLPHYLVRLCAVVGGVFAVSRLLDKVADGILVRWWD